MGASNLISHDVAESDGPKATGGRKSSGIIRMDPAIVYLTSLLGLRTPSGLVSSHVSRLICDLDCL